MEKNFAGSREVRRQVGGGPDYVIGGQGTSLEDHQLQLSAKGGLQRQAKLGPVPGSDTYDLCDVGAWLCLSFLSQAVAAGTFNPNPARTTHPLEDVFSRSHKRFKSL